MKQLTVRQSKIIMMFYVCISKIMILPSIIFSKVRNDFWTVLIILFLFEFLFLMLILNINKKFSNIPFKELFEQKFGKTITKIFYFLIGIILIFKTCMLLHQIFLYLYESLYVDFSWLYMLFPSAIFACYMSSRNLKNFGRTIEMCCYVILGCILIAWLDSVPNVELLNLLPVLNENFTSISSAILDVTIWFGDFIILFFILGNIKEEKNISKEIIKGWIYGVVITLITCFLFFGMYGFTSSLRTMALIDLTNFAAKLSKSGNFIWFVNILWPVILYFVTAFLTFLASQSYNYCFSARHNYRFMLSIVVVIATIIVLFIFDFSLINFVNFITSGFNLVIFFIQYVIPFILLIAINVPIRKKEMEYAK